MTSKPVDWKSIRNFETRFETLISTLIEQYWKLLNDGEQQDIMATEQAITGLFADRRLKSLAEELVDQMHTCDDDEERRILEVFQRVVTSETVARSPLLSEIKNDIRQSTLSYQTVIDGKPYSASELIVILRDSEDRSLRRKAYESLEQLTKNLEPKFQAGWKTYRELVKPLGYDSFIEFQLQSMEINRKQLLVSLDNFFDIIQPVRRKMVDRVKEWGETAGIKGDDLQPWDTQYISTVAQKKLKPYFPSYKAIDVLQKTYQILGFDVDHFPINIDSERKSHKKESFAFCASIRIPDDIRVSVSPSDGVQFYRILFHEYGHALHFACIDQKDALLKRPDTPALTETMSLLSELVMCDVLWPSKFVHLDDSLIPLFHTVNRIQSLRWIYSVMAGIQFELRVYDDPDCDIKSLRREIGKKYGFFKFDTDFTMGEGEFILFMESPLYLTGYFYANMNAVKIYNYLCRDQSIFERDPGKTGKFIENHFYKYGNRYTWYDLINQAIDTPFSMDEFARHFEL